MNHTRMCLLTICAFFCTTDGERAPTQSRLFSAGGCVGSCPKPNLKLSVCHCVCLSVAMNMNKVETKCRLSRPGTVSSCSFCCVLAFNCRAVRELASEMLRNRLHE